MKTIVRIFIASMIVLLMGSMPGSGADARSGHGGHGGHGSHVGFSLWLGPGWWGPYYYPSYYPYYAEPPIVIQEQPEVYVQPAPQSEQPSYWYYCKEKQAYYPYVKQCPNGWMKVVPTPPSSPTSPQE